MIKSMLLYSSCSSFQINSCHTSSIFLSYPANLYLGISKISFDFPSNQRFLHLNVKSQRLQRKFAVCNCIPPGVPLSSGPPSDPSWKGWILGIVVTVLLPFLTIKWGPLHKIKNEVDIIAETAERMSDAVEKVAEKVEKVSEELGDDLPAGKLKNAALLIEQLAEATDKSAELLGDFIDKVQEVEESVEKLIETSADGAKEATKEPKLDQDHKS